MKKKKIIKRILIGFIILLFLGGFTFLIIDLMEPIKLAITNKSIEPISLRFTEYGIFTYLVVFIFQSLLILLTFLPTSPLQIISGIILNPIYAFITILLGVILGNFLMWVLVKKGMANNSYYNKQLEKYEELNEPETLSKKIILLYLLPVISYGIIAYTCAKSKMKYTKYFLITTIGPIPSIIVSVTLGQLAISESLFIILVLALIILSFLTFKYYKYLHKIFKKKPKKDMAYFQNNVKMPNPFLYWACKNILKIIFYRKVNLEIKNKEILDDVNEPFILLYNHPSKLDWIYSFVPLYPKKINAIMAYYYFTNYKLGRFLHNLGCFPKFLYQPDISAIKNIKKVIKNECILGIAPEGRLSAYGTLETLALATEKLIKHLNIPVYLGKINGGYFTFPKWAKNIRKGKVEITFEKIFSKEDLQTKSLEEIKNILYEKMYYDDFEWNKDRKIAYKSKNLAEGLENMLYVCPKCKSEFTIETKGDMIKCSCCNTEIKLNPYYEFETDEVTIPRTIRDWYLFQKQYEKENILKDNYALKDKVILKLPDPKGKGFKIVGEGLAILDKDGLKYEGTINNETVSKLFKLQNIPAIPFGANENFEVYHDNTLYYFVPSKPQYSVKWSVVGEALYNKYVKENEKYE